MNPLVARVLGVVGAIVLTPLAYVLAWILMPKDVDVEPAVATSA
jgi:phage shock protein PspC (stress-responsive transcriptional regulator)